MREFKNYSKSLKFDIAEMKELFTLLL